MKISMNVKTLIVALAVSLGLSSCSLKDSEYTPVSIAGLSFIHASPTTEKFDVYIENTFVDFQNFGFKTKTDYLRAFPGDRTISVTQKGSITKLKTEIVKLKADSGYSVFVAGRLENISLLALRDDLDKPAVGKAKIRFINLSPDGGNLNLAIKDVTTALAENKAFKEYSSFVPVDAANNVTFEVSDKTSGNVLATIANVKVEEGKIYTIYANGLRANTDDLKFGATIFTHK